MAWLFLLILYWIGGYYFLVYGLPLLGAALGYLGLALGVAIKAAAQGVFIVFVSAVRLAWRAAVLTARGLWLALTFLFFVIEESLRGERHEATDDEDADTESCVEADDLYEAALTLFGLSPDYSRAALDAAFKQAIRKAHPDAGGSVDQAQAVNTARDLLMRRKGWA